MLMLGLTLGLGACASSTAVAPLAGTQWRLVQIGDDSVLPQPVATLVFHANGRVSGHGACNRFNGSFEQTGERLTIGPLAATRMACQGAVGQQESRYLRALQGTHAFGVKDGALLIQTEAAGNTLRLQADKR